MPYLFKLIKRLTLNDRNSETRPRACVVRPDSNADPRDPLEHLNSLARTMLTAIILLTLVTCADAGDPTDPEFQSRSIVALGLWPQEPTIGVGDSLDFVAFGLTATGDTVALDVTWSADQGEIRGNGKGKGRYKARSAGRDKVKAHRDSLSDSTTVTVTGVPVASVEVTPASASMEVGGAVQLTATTKDADGNTLAGRAVSWASSNATAATVSGTGVVSGLAAGTVTITATSEGTSGAASVTVTPGAGTAVPGDVGDLAVVGATETALTLMLTEVDDGSGNPADYAVRYAPSPINWSQAAGSEFVVAGGEVGAALQFEISGLATGTQYDVQGVAFRGELNNGAVYSANLSNVATGVTETNTAPVATVEVTPATASVSEGATVQLTAVLRDAAGNTLAGRAVSWTTSDGAVATVSGSGLVSGEAQGSATITATSEGQSGTAQVTVTGPAPVASVEVTPATTSISEGATVQLTAVLRDAAGNELSGRAVSWSSDAPATASVSFDGLVTGQSAGVAIVSALSEGVSGTAQVTVVAPDTSGSRITGLLVDGASEQTAASGSDNWPLTWCEDGHQYTAWGDGDGFGSSRVSLGFARIEGSHASWTGYNLWTGNGKVRSMLCIDGVLYALRSPNSDTGGWEYKEVLRSTDKGETFSTVANSRLNGGSGGPGEAFYIQFGQNYADNADGYVYIFSVRIDDSGLWDVQEPGVTWLARAPVAGEAFMYPANWEWVTALDGDHNPTWGAYGDRVPVLEDPNGFMRGSAIYLPSFDRYVMVTNHTTRNVGNIAMWEAPDPWGPWTAFRYEFGSSDFPQFAFGNFSPKWLDASGNGVFVWFRPDQWNSVEVQFLSQP